MDGTQVPDVRERTPLHAAALGGAVELMALLVKHKAKPEDADSRLERALHCAARYFASDVAGPLFFLLFASFILLFAHLILLFALLNPRSRLDAR